MEIQRIVVRNKITTRSEISSRFILMTSDNEFSNAKEFILFHGLKRVMNELLKEDFDENELETSMLYTKYKEVLQTGKDNDFFHIAYRLKDDMSVKLSEHIDIFHLIKDLSIGSESLVPWYYADSKHYIADTWWESDEDIINDLLNMPFVEFLVKYKGY